MKKEILKLHAPYQPAGDQPRAIEELIEGAQKGLRFQTLLGVTGSGKTFTAANVIARLNTPTLVIAHNKTLAAQLAQEYRDFFPENAVHYFVSYYDYYQPEAYIPTSDTYIEKEAQINEEIERLRHASTQALLTRRDTIIVSSVSCIYGLGNPEEYQKVNILLTIGKTMDRSVFLRKLTALHFERTTVELSPGTFRAAGNHIEIMPVNERIIYRVHIDDARIARIERMNALTRSIDGEEESVLIFPAKHFVTPEDEKQRALSTIREELKEQLSYLDTEGKILEAERLKRRTKQDIALIEELGYCNGIENYSRHFDGRSAGEPPFTLLSYFPHTPDGRPDFLTIIDESHVTIPQIGGMYAGDKSRKETLIEHGFRLPSAKDNRPLQWNEFEKKIGPAIFTSATPGKYEKEHSEKTVEQIIRPTGLLDPVLEIRGVTEKDLYKGQVQDFLAEAEKTIFRGGRVIATTLTKKMAEDLAAFLKERNFKAEYLHSDIETLERITILSDFRRGKFDCLIGVNLLREGLDLPEVELIGIFDADREGFLRSETSLIQIIGRAARNVAGRVILYADTETESLKRAVLETRRRRTIQESSNKRSGITPTTIIKNIRDITELLQKERNKAIDINLALERERYGSGRGGLQKLLLQKKKEMNQAVKTLDFETAALLRDEIIRIEKEMRSSVIHIKNQNKNRKKRKKDTMEP